MNQPSEYCRVTKDMYIELEALLNVLRPCVYRLSWHCWPGTSMKLRLVQGGVQKQLASISCKFGIKQNDKRQISTVNEITKLAFRAL